MAPGYPWGSAVAATGPRHHGADSGACAVNGVQQRLSLHEPGDPEGEDRERLEDEQPRPVRLHRGWQQVRGSRESHAGQDREAAGAEDGITAPAHPGQGAPCSPHMASISPRSSRRRRTWPTCTATTAPTTPSTNRRCPVHIRCARPSARRLTTNSSRSTWWPSCARRDAVQGGSVNLTSAFLSVTLAAQLCSGSE